MLYIDPNIANLYRVPQPEGRAAFIRLDQNENPDGLPKWFFDEVIKEVTPEFLSIYPEEGWLTEKYGKFLGLTGKNISLCDGSVVGMGYIIKVFGDPSKQLVCVTPSFGMYKAYADMVGMGAIQVPYKPDFTFDINEILSRIDATTGIVVLVNPNMPVGNVYSEEEIRAIVEKANRFNALVIIDEAYHYFYEKTSLKLIEEFDNVVILRTFSKMLSIPALRLGACISNPDIIRCIENFKPHYTVNAVALLFGSKILDEFDRLEPELEAKFKKGRDYLLSTLEKNGYRILRSHGCFMCVQPKHHSVSETYDLLRDKGILVLKGSGLLQDYLRVTICDIKYMEAFTKALFEVDQ